MNRHSRIPSTLAVVIATCLTALAVLVPGAPGADSNRDPGNGRLPGWACVLTGHWGGGDCR